MPDHLDLIGSADACAVLDVNRSTLTRWVADGRITPVTKLPKANGAYLFRRGDVEALARNLANPAEAAS